MRNLDRVTKLAGLIATASLLGCTTAPAPPPILTLDARICAARPDLAAARKLPLEGSSENGSRSPEGVTVNLDASTACLKPAGGDKRVYVLFQLPDSTVPYIITVTSTPVGTGLLSPYVEMLDAQGTVVREAPRDSFMFHGMALRVGLRSHPGERYLLVASDPKSVGQTVSQIIEGTQTTMASTGTVVFTIHTGSDTTTTLTYAHSGSVTVMAEPVPKVN